MFARRRARADIEKALAILQDITWQARVCAQWVRDNVVVARKTDVLSEEDVREISDHADEADDVLLQALLILHPEMRADGEGAQAFEIARFERVPERDQPTPDDIVQQVERALSEALEHTQEGAPYGVGMLSEPQSGFTVEDVDVLWDVYADATESLQAGLHALDPKRFSAEVRQLTDPDERIARASEIEQLELRREIVRRTNAIENDQGDMA